MKFIPDQVHTEEGMGYTVLKNRVPMSGENVNDVGEMRDDSGYFGPSNIPDVRNKKKRFEDQG